MSFLNQQAEKLKGETRPVFLYLLGDHDPSGVNAHESIETTLKAMLPYNELHFDRLGVTEQQIKRWNLPSRPTKKDDSRAAAWGDKRSVELDAIEPNRLRTLVRNAIERHMSAAERNRLREGEAADRARIRELSEEEAAA